jgi:trimeric autotransporter adhesin
LLNTNASISTIYNGVTRSATLTVRSPLLALITLNPTSVPSGSNSTGTATITGPAPAGGASVSLSSSNTLVATVPSSALVPAGQTNVTFLVQSLLVGTARITGTRGVSKSATLTVHF